MAYKKNTIVELMKKTRELMVNYQDMLENGETYKVVISKGNRKIGKVMNVSLMPIIACGKRCGLCMGICYDIKACVQYSNTVLPARVKNTVMAMRNRDEYFKQIDAAISRRRKNKMFRWHVAGDILDYDYFVRMCDIAAAHPDFTFWTYTKMYEVVNEYIYKNGSLPENLSVMFSEWKIQNTDGTYTVVDFPNPYNMPVFAVRFKGEDAPAMHRCPGNCDICKATGRGCPFGESSYADEH